MKKLLGLLLSLSATGAFAAAENGLYVEVAGGLGWNNFASPAMAFRADLGYQILPGFALEVGTTGITQSGSTINQNTQFYDLSAKGILPIYNIVDLWLKVGAAYATPGAAQVGNDGYVAAGEGGINAGAAQAATAAGWNALTAIGIDFNVTRSFAFGVSDYLYYGSNNAGGTANVMLVSAKFSF